MGAFTRILCPIDFSEPSHAASLVAAELAKNAGAPLTLVHVLEGPAPPSMLPSSSSGLRDLNEKIAADIEQNLQRWQGEALAAGAPTVDFASPDGVPWHEIVRLARDGQYDLVVLGTHGATGIKRVLLGSVAERVARHASCSVLVVRTPGEGART